MAIPQIRSVGSSSGTVNNLGRNNLVIGETVTLSDTNAANSGHPHVWTMVDRPIGSSSSLTTPSGATATFVPDVTGTYFIRCTVDGVSIREVLIAVPLPVSGGRIPAFSEQLQYDGGSNTKGWHETMTAIVRALDAARAVRETSGPTVLTMAGVADGKVLARSGNTIVGVNGGHIIEDDGTPVTTRSNLNFKGALTASDGGSGPDRIDVDIEANGVADAMIRQSTALSLIGRSANSTGNVADISTTSGTGAVLRESGGTLGFGTVSTAGLAANAVTDAVIRQAAALSVIGRGANSTGNVADISVAAGSGLVLRESGNVLSFGTVGSSGLAAYSVVNGKIRQGAARTVIGNATAATADVDDIAATNASDAVLRESGGTIGFGTIATAGIANLAVTAAKIANATITATQIANATITTALLAANCVDNTILRQGGALSVIGRSANSTGNVADIQAANASDAVLRESGGAIGFGQVATAGIADLAVTAAKIANTTITAAKIANATITATQIANAAITTALLAANCVDDTILRQGAARTVIGRSANSTGNVADIAGAGANTYLSDDGATLAFRNVTAVKESGGQVLTLGSISDGQWVKRSGNTLVTTATVSGVTGSSPWFSMISAAAASSVGVSGAINVAGDTAIGIQFYCTKAVTITGVRFYWITATGGTTQNIRCVLWQSSSFANSGSTGTNLAEHTQAATTTGAYTSTFTTPVTLTPYTPYIVSAYNTSAATSTQISTGNFFAGTVPPAVNSCIGPFIVLFSWSKSGSGNVYPGSTSGGVYMFVEPVVSDPSL